MPFQNLMNDKIDVLKKDGTKIESLKASVQKNRLFMNAGKILIEPGDLIQRHMSNGAEETYQVINPGFYEGLGGIPANYQMEVTKLGIPEAKQAVQSITYNISGNNARFNQNSIDNSTNIVKVDARVTEQIAALRNAIDELQLPDEQRTSSHEIVDSVEEQFKSGAPKKSVVTTLLNALPKIANVVEIVATIVKFL
jgi:hypothetical protein